MRSCISPRSRWWRSRWRTPPSTMRTTSSRAVRCSTPRVLRVAQGRASALEVYGTDYPTPDGTAVRDYIHVLDLADAHIRALDAELDGAVAVNLGTGTGSSVLAVADAARRVTGNAIKTVA